MAPTRHEVDLTAVQATSAVIAKLSVDRGLNELWLAVLGILVTIGLTVGIGFDATWWVV
jgi:hypothetical protein